MNPKVSILITFYNQEKYVDKALQSVFDQKTNFEFEVIVGDDGSTDNTCNVVNAWIKKYPDRIRLCIMERSQGPIIPGFRASQNRINLLKYVKGEYFVFLDGDDYFSDENKLMKQVSILDADENFDCIACAHNIDSLYADGLLKPNTSIGLKEGKYLLKSYWRKIYFHTDTLLIRSSVISKLPINLLENNFNDNLITFSIFQHGKIYYIPESMAIYLQTGDGVWTKGNIVVNLIRNIFMYDLCLQINPSLKKETLRRLGGNFYRIFLVRKKINSSELQLLAKEAEEKRLINAKEWIHYNELSIYGKVGVCAKACWYAVLSKLV